MRNYIPCCYFHLSLYYIFVYRPRAIITLIFLSKIPPLFNSSSIGGISSLSGVGRVISVQITTAVRFPRAILGIVGEPMGFSIASLIALILSSTPGTSFNKQIFNKFFWGILTGIFSLP